MGLGGVISNLLSLGAKLLPAVSESVQAPSSSSSPSVEGHQIEAELKALMRMLERIKATLYDAERREIVDLSVKLWLKELKQVAYDAEDVLDEYNYEILRAQIEARDASGSLSSRKRKLIQVPDCMLNKVQLTMSRFAELEKDLITLGLLGEDEPKCFKSELQLVPTNHLVIEPVIIGREREKEKVIDLLSSECHGNEVVSVMAIVGIGGLGKTILAQLVYNNQRIRYTFDEVAWVWVSEYFDVQKLTKEVLEYMTGESIWGLPNLSYLQMKIHEEIKGKRVLLVLDDVWNENRNLWELFLGPFRSAELAKILVTTRNKSVAQIVQTVPTFNLGYPSRKQCWKLFQHYAYGGVNQNEDSNFVEIGKKIVEKCGRLPLAVKSLACLLRHEVKEEYWREIIESELWEFDARDQIFLPLQISYARLPTCLKPCLLYCSIFPKDYTFTVRELVQLWSAQGFIESDGEKSTEKVGQEYAKQLWH